MGGKHGWQKPLYPPLIFDPAGFDRDKHVLLQGPQLCVRLSLGPVQLCPLKHWDRSKIDRGTPQIV